MKLLLDIGKVFRYFSQIKLRRHETSYMPFLVLFEEPQISDEKGER